MLGLGLCYYRWMRDLLVTSLRNFKVTSNLAILALNKYCSIQKKKIKKEALALVMAPQHFDDNIGSGCLLVVYTDYNPLNFLRSLQNLNQRLMRWPLFLQPHHLDIHHIKGRDNILWMLCHVLLCHNTVFLLCTCLSASSQSMLPFL